jgi:hypothetical protein
MSTKYNHILFEILFCYDNPHEGSSHRHSNVDPVSRRRIRGRRARRPHDTGRSQSSGNPRHIDQTICQRGWTKTIRPPEKYTYRLKRTQLHRPNSPYFVADAYLRDFEEDHRVPLGLGGASHTTGSTYGPSLGMANGVPRRRTS